MSVTQEVERGRLAAEVLENPIYREAMDKLQTEIVAAWQVEKDERSRDWLWTMAQAAKRLDKVLVDTMNTGLMARKQIELQQTRLERAGKTLRGAFRR